VPPHALFPQLLRIVQKYLDEKVRVAADADLRDLMLAPWYGWVVERLREALRPDTREGDAPELPVYEKTRPDGSTAEVEYWTRIEPYAVQRSHVNAVVAHSGWEKTAAYELDNHTKVEAFVKNAGLGFAIPYLLDGEPHDYVPDFIVRLKGGAHLIVETKGYDQKKEVKRAAAERWVSAVNADGSKGRWAFALVESADQVRAAVDHAIEADEMSSVRAFLASLDRVHRRKALRDVFAFVDQALLDGRFTLCDALFDQLDPARLDVTVATGFLAITVPARAKLKRRDAYAERLDQWLRRERPNDVERLLAGLR
jgi:hypothetical protein